MKYGRKNISKLLASLIISSFALSGGVMQPYTMADMRESVPTIFKLRELYARLDNPRKRKNFTTAMHYGVRLMCMYSSLDREIDEYFLPTVLCAVVRGDERVENAVRLAYEPSEDEKMTISEWERIKDYVADYLETIQKKDIPGISNTLLPSLREEQEVDNIIDLAYFCKIGSIYDVDFRSLLEKYTPRNREKLEQEIRDLAGTDAEEQNPR